MADERERPKRSWREIDLARDRSEGRGSAPNRSSPTERKGGRQSSYKAALNRLFASGDLAKSLAKQEATSEPVADARLVALNRVKSAIGPDEITRAIDDYLAAHAWPKEDFEFTSAALEHRKQPMIDQALAELERMLTTGKPRRAATLIGRLRTLEELGPDPEICSMAKKLRSKL